MGRDDDYRSKRDKDSGRDVSDRDKPSWSEIDKIREGRGGGRGAAPKVDNNVERAKNRVQTEYKKDLEKLFSHGVVPERFKGDFAALGKIDAEVAAEAEAALSVDDALPDDPADPADEFDDDDLEAVASAGKSAGYLRSGEDSEEGDEDDDLDDEKPLKDGPLQLLAAIAQSTTAAGLKKAVAAYLKTHDDFPDNEEVLIKVLDYGDEAVVLKAVRGLAGIVAERPLDHRRQAMLKLETVALTARDDDLIEEAESLKNKLS